tara:strand:+ start:1368 stop:2051 length:684 start_codon:yes stop_codon:yes gene_type:complete
MKKFLINLVKAKRLIFNKPSNLAFNKFPIVNGKPYPWLTRPCNDFLDKIDFKNKTVLEFGSGFSTQYFDRRGAKVISYEREQKWIDILKKNISNQTDIRTFSDNSKEGDDDYFNEILNDLSHLKSVDVLVVDVFPRPKTFEKFLHLVSDNGFIVFDNSDWYPQFFSSLKKQDNILVIDFYGVPIGGAKEQCTSIIFKRKNIPFKQNSGASTFSNSLISEHDRPFNEQ